MKQKNSIVLNCFTPPVALATFFVEILFAAYILMRYKRDQFVNGVAVLLTLLGVFQLSEYMLCTGGDQWWWLRIGHVAITFLPPLGLQLVRMQTKSRERVAMTIAYLVAAGFSIAYFVLPDVLSFVACTGKFIVFNDEGTFNTVYGIFYLSFLAWAVTELIVGINKKKGDRILLKWMLVGYASFLVPTMLIYILIEYARIGLPSIMCGFAVLLSVITVCAVMPRHQELQRAKLVNISKKRR